MAKNRQPVAKRCKALGISPATIVSKTAMRMMMPEVCIGKAMIVSPKLAWIIKLTMTCSK